MQWKLNWEPNAVMNRKYISKTKNMYFNAGVTGVFKGWKVTWLMTKTLCIYPQYLTTFKERIILDPLTIYTQTKRIEWVIWVQFYNTVLFGIHERFFFILIWFLVLLFCILFDIGGVYKKFFIFHGEKAILHLTRFTWLGWCAQQ